jgi:outer membrane protein
MKNTIKILLAVAAVFCTSALYGQQMGVLNTQELIEIMPETIQAQAELEAAAQQFSETLETIRVEFNTKMADYQRDQGTLTDAMRQMRERELSDISARHEEFQQIAQRDMEVIQRQLMEPIFNKIDEIVGKVARDNGIAMVFDTSMGVTLFVDETKVTNLLPLVKRELGIQ